ncbi:Hypothetical protein GLP15_3660 [Giardia lamblia P15]|uniref:Uncharacterized protein n=1 Tax=Giardia intestinalis (strain P15) TaxID=658858 RepID=E1EYS3_GIAIA|nr:Hypothetical protein GLP15_3660 [Giardia lamblia P15]
MIGQAHGSYFAPTPAETRVSIQRAVKQTNTVQRPRLADVILASDHWCSMLTGFTPDQVRLLHAIGTADPEQIVLSLRPRVQWSISLLKRKNQEPDHQDAATFSKKRARRRKRMFEADDSLIVLLTYLHQGCALMEVYDKLNLDRHCSAATEQRRQQTYTDINSIKSDLDHNLHDMSAMLRKVQQNKVARTSMLIKDAITNMKASFVRAFIELPREFRDELFPPFPETDFPELNACPLMIDLRTQSTPRQSRLSADAEEQLSGQRLRSEVWIGRTGLAAFVFSNSTSSDRLCFVSREASESTELLSFIGVDPVLLNLGNQMDITMSVQACAAREAVLEERRALVSQHYNRAAALFQSVTSCYRRDPSTYSDFIVLIHALTNYHILESMFIENAMTDKLQWSKDEGHVHENDTQHPSEPHEIDVAL